jgi:hypothetical protein
MSVRLPQLEQYLNALGDVTVLLGDLNTPGGLSELGAKEGNVRVELNTQINHRTFPEQTGPAIHEAEYKGESPVITIPTIISSATVFGRVHPLGSPGGGRSMPEIVLKTSLVLASTVELRAAEPTGFAYGGSSWTPQAPVNWVWFPTVYLMIPELEWQEPEIGKMVSPIQAQVLYTPTWPEGKKLYWIGDPTVAFTGPPLSPAITTIRI